MDGPSGSTPAWEPVELTVLCMYMLDPSSYLRCVSSGTLESQLQYPSWTADVRRLFRFSGTGAAQPWNTSTTDAEDRLPTSSQLTLNLGCSNRRHGIGRLLLTRLRTITREKSVHHAETGTHLIPLPNRHSLSGICSHTFSLAPTGPTAGSLVVPSTRHVLLALSPHAGFSLIISVVYAGDKRTFHSLPLLTAPALARYCRLGDLDTVTPTSKLPIAIMNFQF